MKRLTLTTLACLLFLTLSLYAQDATITNARIVVANGTVIERGSIVVRGGKIVSAAAGAPATTSGKVIDAKGMTAMPGFIDAHRHINTGPNEKAQMQAQLEAGYTTILSGGGPAEATSRSEITSRRAPINGPRIIPSGSLRLNNHTPESARAEIRKMAEMGVKFTGEIALTPVPGPSEKELEVLRAVVDEGKKAGVFVQVHAVSTSAMVAAVDAGVRLLVHLPNKDFTSKEAAKKVADSGTKVLGTVGFGTPVFGVFAEDNLPRFRDGKPWPESIVDGVRLGEEAGYMPVNARTVWDAGAVLGLLHRYYVRPESRPGTRVENDQSDVLHAGHHQNDGSQHRVLHSDGRPTGDAGGGQAGGHYSSGRQPAGRVLEHAQNQSRAQRRRGCSG
jgi:hypothetical protein